ncbi:MAG: CBS domain-containing protein [Firmicutes bacterium]|nr:CBS domain-containing protein [Bacillota bacterium]
MLAKDIMTREVITVSPDTPVTEVAEVLLENRISGLPVVNAEGELMGVVSEADLLYKEKDVKGPRTLSILGAIIYLERPQRLENELKKIAGAKVRDVMTKEVVTVHEDTPIHEIANVMIDRGINRVPVMRHKNLVGIITRADIVRSLLSDHKA